MLRKAEHARFQEVRVGGIVRKKIKTYFFPDKGTSRAREVGERELRHIRHKQQKEPAHVWSSGSRNYWMFRNHFYSESDNLSAADVKALLLDRERKVERRLEQAKTVLPAQTEHTVGRAPIPDNVKLLVWQRDGGRCVRCGSQERLEYDHVIPVVMGGSNTARNIQLLCERCNRQKGGHLT